MRSVHLDCSPRCEVAPVALNHVSYRAVRQYEVTYHRLRRGIVVFSTVLVRTLPTLPYEDFFTAYTCVAAAEAVASDTDNLHSKWSVYISSKNGAHTSARKCQVFQVMLSNSRFPRPISRIGIRNPTTS
jgi:hypothetical protein